MRSDPPRFWQTELKTFGTSVTAITEPASVLRQEVVDVQVSQRGQQVLQSIDERCLRLRNRHSSTKVTVTVPGVALLLAD